jgi:hypothetical protein
LDEESPHYLCYYWLLHSTLLDLFFLSVQLFVQPLQPKEDLYGEQRQQNFRRMLFLFIKQRIKMSTLLTLSLKMIGKLQLFPLLAIEGSHSYSSWGIRTMALLV